MSNLRQVNGIEMFWHPEQGACTFEGLPVAMMWVDSTLAGLAIVLRRLEDEIAERKRAESALLRNVRQILDARDTV